MKVLFYRYGSILEPDIIDTYHEIGLDIDEYTTEITNKNISQKESVTQVGNYLMDHPVDFVFSINFFPFLSEICNVFHIRYLSWIVDAPVMELYSTAIENPWNRTFIFDRAVYEEIHPLNPDCVFHLPLGANVSPKDQRYSGSRSLSLRFSYTTVTFYGLSSQRVQIQFKMLNAVRNPGKITLSGLASSPFARHY